MSEIETNSEEPGAVTGMGSPGARLRQARKACDLSIEDVATHLKLSTDKIKSLESGEISSIAAPVFVAGYLRAYAKLVGLPGDEIVSGFDALAEMNAPSLDLSSGPATQDYGRVSPDSFTDKVVKGGYGWGRFLIWASLAVVLIVLGYVFVGNDGIVKGRTTEKFSSLKMMSDEQSVDQDEKVKSNIIKEEIATALQPGVDEASDESISDESASVKSTPGESSPGESTLGDSRMITSMQTMPKPVTPESTIPDSTKAKPKTDTEEKALDHPVAIASAEYSQLTISFNEESWVEVYDAMERRLLFQLGKAGMKHTVKGIAPFKVQLGYVPGVSISYNGEPYNLDRYGDRRSVRIRIGKAGEKMSNVSPSSIDQQSIDAIN